MSNRNTATPSPKRQPLSKRLRFEVFKRDNFTCQYCGAQPPKVILEVDHIHPVAEGGDCEQENLITACDKCNRGKGKRLLGDKIVRPDADVMWLQAQQEIAELKRYQRAKKQRDAAIAQTIETLQQHWFAVTDLDWCPSVEFTRRLLIHNSPEVVEYAFTVVAPKVESGQLRDASEWRPYMFSVCRNRRNDTSPNDNKIGALAEQLKTMEGQRDMMQTVVGLLLEDSYEDYGFEFEFDLTGYAVLWEELKNGDSRLRWDTDSVESCCVISLQRKSRDNG